VLEIRMGLVAKGPQILLQCPLSPPLGGGVVYVNDDGNPITANSKTGGTALATKQKIKKN